MKQYSGLFLVLFIGLLVVSVSFADPPITGNWTINNPLGNAALTNYPVLLSLTTIAPFGLSSCYNNTFYYINGSNYTQIPHMVDSATGGCKIWVKVPYIPVYGQPKMNIGVVPNTNESENGSAVFSWFGDFTLGSIPTGCTILNSTAQYCAYSFSSEGIKLFHNGANYPVCKMLVQCAAATRNVVYESKTKISSNSNYGTVPIGSSSYLSNAYYSAFDGSQIIKAMTSNDSLWYMQTKVSGGINGTHSFSSSARFDDLFHINSLYTYADNTTLYIDNSLIHAMTQNLYYAQMNIMAFIESYNYYGAWNFLSIEWMRVRPLQENGEPILIDANSQIVIIPHSPINNTAYNNTPVILNFTLNMSVPTAVCHYYIDGVSNYWPLIINNNTPYDVPLTLSLGSHDILVDCNMNSINGNILYSNITNSSTPPMFDALSIITPLYGATTHYSNITIQYIMDSTNVTSASCQIQNVNWTTDLPFENVSTNIGITRHISLAQGAQWLVVYCENGTQWISEDVLFDVEPIVPMIAYPANNSVLHSNNFIFTYAYVSGDLLSANCDMIVDSAPPIGVFPTPSGGFYNLFANMSSGMHNISTFCSNGSWNGSSPIYRISIAPETINLLSPQNNTATCNSNNTLFSFSWSSYTHSNGTCGVSIDSPWDINTDPELDILAVLINNPERTANSTSGFSLGIYANNLTNGFHNASVWCADADNSSIWSIHSPLIQFVVEPVCITIDHLDTSNLCDNQNVTVNLKTESLIAPGSFCYITLDQSIFIGTAYLLNNTYYNLTITNVSSGVHTIGAFCDTNYNPSMRAFSANYTFSSGNVSCVSSNFIDSLGSFIENWTVIIMMLSFIMIAIVTYIGWRLAGSMGGLLCMIGLIIIFAVIPSPSFIPLWIAIISIIAGLIGLIYTQKNGAF